MASVLAVVSDLHVGSTLGLLAPGSMGEDGMPLELSPGQRWMWGCWKAFWSEIWTLKTKYGRRLVVVVNGDLCDGDGNAVVQRWTRDLRVQVDAATLLLGPIAQMADVVFTTRGTPFHNRHGGQADAAVAERIGSREVDGQPAAYRLLVELEGVLLDVAHHVSLSTRPWTTGGNVNRLAAMIRDQAADGVVVPDLVVRSHAHACADSGTARKPRVIVTPAWQLITEFVGRINSVAMADVGGTIAVLQDGQADVRFLRYRPEDDQAVQV